MFFRVDLELTSPKSATPKHTYREPLNRVTNSVLKLVEALSTKVDLIPLTRQPLGRFTIRELLRFSTVAVLATH